MAVDLRMNRPHTWYVTLASLVPLWLFSLSVMAEGFPQPPISAEGAVISFSLAILIGILLLWKGWITIELMLYSIFPFLFLAVFDEISTAYKTPYIILCAIILSLGIIVYQQVRSRWWGLIILLGTAGLTYVLAWHATLSFWRMAGELGYEQCFPDAHGCAPLTGGETPYRLLIFRLWAW